MSSSPTGVDAIKRMLADGNLQKVSPSAEAATAFLDAADKHLDSALAITASEADGACSLLYDAARKSLAALLQTQGLRATSRGGHYAIQEAIAAQFTNPPPSAAFRSFGRLRRARNQIEYDDSSATTPDDVTADVETVRAILAMVRQLIAIVPVFTD